MVEILTIILLGFSVISPMKEMGFNRLERTRAMRQVYSERTQDSLNVRLVGRWPYGTNYAVAVAKNYAYLGCGGVVFVLDIQDIKNPEKVAEIITPGVVRGLDASGDYLYVVNGNALRIVDISNPREPKKVGVYSTSDFFWIASQIRISGNYAYMASSPNVSSEHSGDLLILDVSNPSNPKRIGVFKTEETIEDFYIQEDYAYIADGENGFLIADISNPSNPKEVGSYEGEITVVYVSDSYAYLGSYREGNFGMEIVDISDPSNPQGVSFYEVEYPVIPHSDIFVSGKYAYLLTYELKQREYQSFLKILDISDPSQPREVSVYNLLNPYTQVLVEDSLAYVLCPDKLYILNVSDPSEPRKECTYRTPGALYSVYACSS